MVEVLVTGGYGFIGSHVVERFRKEKHNITVIDNMCTGLPDHLPKDVRTFHLAVEDQKCARIFRETAFDVVIHLATVNDPGALQDHELLVADNNGLSNMLYLAHKHQVAKFIILSPYPVYGRQNSLPISEEAILQPDQAAGFHYLTRETLCGEYRRRGMEVVVLRVGSIYGPRQNNSHSFMHQAIMAGVSGRAVDEALAGEILHTGQKDYIYVSDVVDAIYRVSENKTSDTLNISSGQGTTNQALWQICTKHCSQLGDPEPPPPTSPEQEEQEQPPDYVLDNEKARRELEWALRYSLEEGMAKTIAWARQTQNDNQLTSVQTQPRARPLKKFFTPGRFNHDLETGALFALFALLNYLLQYRLSLGLDLFIFYILLVSIFYGLRQSLTAIALASMAHLWFKFTFEEMLAIRLVSDINTIMYLTMYFLIGIGVGYVVDKMRQEQEALAEELSCARSEVDFINEMHQKCMQVKNGMQYMLENYQNNYGAIFNVVTRLNQVPPDFILSEAAPILAHICKAKTVAVYHVARDSQWLRLVAAVGPVKYGRSIITGQYNFLDAVINRQTTMINKDLHPRHPLVCAPVCVGHKTLAVIFIDEIQFTHLNQHFVNLLKIMTNLIASTMANAHQYESAGDIKYFPRTVIMRRHWFKKLIDYHRERQNETGQPFVFTVIKGVRREDYRQFSQQIKTLIRAVDCVGEMKDGQLGIIIPVVDQDGVLIMQDRLLRHGIKVVLTRLEGLSA